MSDAPAPLAALAATATPDKQPDTSNGADAATPSVTEVKQQEAFSPKFAALAKKEKAIRQQARKLEMEREALSREQEELKQTKSWRSRLSEDPLSVMAEAGLGYDQLTQLILNQGTPENVNYQKLRQEMKQELKAHEEQMRSQLEKQKQDQYEQAKVQIKNEVAQLVDSNEEFEAISANGELAKEAVVELIEQTFKDDGYLMPIDEAAKAVEEHLVEQAYTLAKLKKVQSRLQPTPIPPPEEVQKPGLQQKQLSTLSNRITSSTTKPMSERERRERAILAFEGKL